MSHPHRILCIGGAPSSGTTLLADLLDAVPGILCGPELNIFCMDEAFEFDGPFKLNTKRKHAFDTGACYSPRSRFFNLRYLEPMGLDADALASMINDASTLAEFVQNLALRFAEFRGRSLEVFAEKTPINVNHATDFCRMFPHGLFIHTVRDGRAVVGSLLRRGFSLWEAALAWMVQTSHGRFAACRMPNMIELRFEDLLAAPFHHAAAIAEMCGIGATPAEIEASFARNEYREGLPRVESWSASHYTGHIVNPRPYSEQLSRDQILMLEAASLIEADHRGMFQVLTEFSGLLRNYNYPTTAKPDCRRRIGMDMLGGAYREYLAHAENLDVQSKYLITAVDGACSWKGWHAGASMRWLVHALATDATEIPRLGRAVGWRGLAQIVALDPFGAIGTHNGTSDMPRNDDAWTIARRGGVFAPGIAPPIASFIDRRAVDEARSGRSFEHYRLRMLFPKSLAGGFDPEDVQAMRRLVSELFWVHCAIFQRRFEAGRPVSAEDAATLVLASTVAQRTLIKPSKTLEELRDKAAADLTDELVAWLQSPDSTGPIPESASGHLRVLHDAATGAPITRVPSYGIPARGAMVAIITAPTSDHLEHELRATLSRFLDLQVGLFRQDHSSTSGETTPRLFISALTPLAMAMASDRLEGDLSEPANVVPRPALAVDHDAVSADQHMHALVEHVALLRAPPRLPASLSPRCPDRWLPSLERAVIKAARSAALESQGWCVQVLPCPPDCPGVLSVRHDVDRPLNMEKLTDILRWEMSLGIRSSWYFKPETYRRDLAALILDHDCEVGWHASRIDTGDCGFVDRLRSDFPGRIKGMTFHGGPGSLYWNGLEAVEHAARLGFEYTEMLCEFVPHPYSIETSRGAVMLTPFSVKYDAYPAWLTAQMKMITDAQGHAIIENHPDLLGPAFADFVAGLLDQGAVATTVLKHVEFCRNLELATLNAPGDTDSNADFEIQFNCTERCWLNLEIDSRRWRLAAPARFDVEASDRPQSRWMIQHGGGSSSLKLARQPSS